METDKAERKKRKREDQEILQAPETLLSQAVKTGNFIAAKKLLETKSDANQQLPLQDNGGQSTLLMLAAARGDDALVSLLLEKNAKTTINRASDDGTTALSLAAQSHESSTVALLVNANANMDLRSKLDDMLNVTALHIATYLGNANTVFTLCQAKANLNLQDAQGKTALHLAAETGSATIVQVLLDAKADSSIRDGDGLTAEELSDDDDLVSMFQEAKKEPGLKFNPLPASIIIPQLSTAIDNGHLLDAKKIIKAKSSLNIINYVHGDITPLIRAAQLGNYPLIQALLDSKADINASSPLSGDRTAICSAASCANSDSVVLLMNAKANLSKKDDKGNTALHYAIQFNLTNAVFALCRAKADVFSPNLQGQTPLQKAYQQRLHNESIAYHAIDKNEKLAKQNTLISLLEERAKEQRDLAFLTGLHPRAGAKSCLSQLRTNFFDPQSMRIPLALARSPVEIESDITPASAPGSKILI